LLNYDASIESDQQRGNRMRKVVAGLFISLDGVAESPDQWQFDVFDDAMGAEITRQINEQDTMLLGRVTYGEWKHYWPESADEPFASYINQTPKYVVSTTLDKVEWGQWNTVSLLKGDLADEINKLKSQPGKNIGVAGSISLVQSLMQQDLLDELRLMVHPVIVNRGKRLYRDGDALKRLNLIEHKTSSTGVLLLTYQLRRET
jgi:dihydrofolate reductase